MATSMSTEERVSQLEAVVEAIVDRIDANHNELMRRIDSLQSEVNGMGSRIDGLESRIDGLGSQIRTNHDAVMKELGRISSGGALN